MLKLLDDMHFFLWGFYWKKANFMKSSNKQPKEYKKTKTKSTKSIIMYKGTATHKFTLDQWSSVLENVANNCPWAFQIPKRTDYVRATPSTSSIKGQDSKHPRNVYPFSSTNQTRDPKSFSASHWIPKDCKTKHHNFKVAEQCNHKWSTVSSLQGHMQHHPTSI